MSAELRALTRLSLPLALAQLGNMLLGVVDTAVVGRLGEVALGAVGLGTTLFFGLTILGMGVLLGTDPLVAQAVGAGETAQARRIYWQGVWLALACAVPLGTVVVAGAALVPNLGLPEAPATQTATYMLSRLPSLPFFFLTVAARSYLQGHAITRPMVLGTVLANVVNLPLSWLLVLGDPGLVRLGLSGIGLGPMGVAGAGYATVVASLIQCAFVVVAVGSTRDGAGPVRRGLDVAILKRALGMGLPMGLTMLAEFSAFTIVTLLTGYLGTRSLAGHNVAMVLASTTFQVPVAIGAAASVRVGQAIGRSDGVGTRRAGLTAMAAGLGFMAFTGFSFLAMPALLARLITDKPEVIAAAVPLILVAAAFQLVDGLQAVAAGVLRGAGDTRFAFLSNLVGHYAIGLPIGVALAFGLGWGAPGLWWGLSAGLTAVAVALSARFALRSRTVISRS